MNPCVLFTVFNRTNPLRINIKVLKKYAGIDIPIIISTNYEDFLDSDYEGCHIVKNEISDNDRGSSEKKHQGELDNIINGLHYAKSLGYDWVFKITGDEFIFVENWLSDTIHNTFKINNNGVLYVPNASNHQFPTYFLSQVFFLSKLGIRNMLAMRTDIFGINVDFALNGGLPREISPQFNCPESTFFAHISKIYPPVFSPWWLLGNAGYYAGKKYLLNDYIFHSHDKYLTKKALIRTGNEQLLSGIRAYK